MDANEKARNAAARPFFPVRRFLVLTFLLVSAAAAGMLALQHLMGLKLPGCGPASGCASLAEGPWGSVYGWPVSFVGVSYFLGLAVVWPWASRGGVVPSIKWLIRLGVLGSAGFVTIMAVERQFCLYCAVSHASNFAVWFVVETLPTIRRSSRRALAALATAAALISVAVGLAKWQVRADALAVARQAATESIVRIVDRSGREDATPPGVSAGGFTGRYRLGPQAAKIRLVVLSDYECKDCWAIEDQIETVTHGRDDISWSAKQFPLCRDCNRTIRYAHFHDNACRAAQAAEAAGLLAGNDGFWRMHHWLFQQKGKFTDDELRSALPELGLDDAVAFFEAMQGDEVRRRIEDDVDEGIELGIDGTSTIYINGFELQGADEPGTLARAVAALDAANVPVRTAAADRPPGQVQRRIARWQEQPIEERLPAEPSRWSLGPEDATVRVVLFFDHANPFAADVWRNVRTAMGDRADVRLDLYLFPLSKELNPLLSKMKEERFPQAAAATRLVAAAGQVGGADSFWQMHDWLLNQQDSSSPAGALQDAGAFGLDPDVLTAAADGPEVAAAIAADIERAAAAEVKWASTIFIDRHKVSTPLPDVDLLVRMFDLAAQQSGVQVI